MFNLILLKLRNKVRIKGRNNKIFLSDKNRIRYCEISLKGNNSTLSFDNGANLKGVFIEIDGDNCSVQIGKNTVIGESTYLSCRGNNTELTIGENCMFSRNVKVMTSDGHNITQNSVLINPNASIHIGDKTWLADNCVILKGTEIKSGAVVGIDSVVTKNVAENSIVAGNPAKMIKQNIAWSKELTL